MHKLPKQLGWGLGLLAFVGSLVWDFQRAPESDPVEMLMKAAMWGGLCSVLAAVVGYLLFLALGGNEAEELEMPEPLAAPEPMPMPGRFVDLSAGDDQVEEPPSAAAEDLRGYAPDDIAQAVRSQLADGD